MTWELECIPTIYKFCHTQLRYSKAECQFKFILTMFNLCNPQLSFTQEVLYWHEHYLKCHTCLVRHIQTPKARIEIALLADEYTARLLMLCSHDSESLTMLLLHWRPTLSQARRRLSDSLPCPWTRNTTASSNASIDLDDAAATLWIMLRGTRLGHRRAMAQVSIGMCRFVRH